MISAREANRGYFRQAYRTGQHGWAVDVQSPYALEYLRRLKKIVPRGKLLDVGCGEGRHSIAAAKLGFRVTAVDFEPLALKRVRRFARQENANGIRFRQADVLRLPFPNASFDIVLDYGCLHHQRKSDWGAYMSSILRALKPQGYYVLSVFSPRFRLFHGSGRPWHIARGAYRRYFTRGDINALFGPHFEVMRMTEERGEGGGFWHVLMKRRAQSC